jgi:uncharacterized RmlC-like cupin family protein
MGGLEGRGGQRAPGRALARADPNEQESVVLMPELDAIHP